MAGHTEASGGDLLNRRAFGIAVIQRLKTNRVFTAFTGVGFAAQAIHGNGQCFMGFG